MSAVVALHRVPRWAWPVLLVAVLVSAGLLGDQVLAYRLAQLSIFALLFVSLVVLTGWSGTVSLLSAAYLGVGAFATATLLERTAVPFLAAVPLAGLVTALASLLVGIPVLRLRPSAFIVMTLAFASLLQQVVFTGEWCCGGGVRGVAAPRPAFATTDRAYLVLCASLLGLTYLATMSWGRSRIGRAVRATRDDPAAAEALGVNATKARLLAFAVSGFVAGLAGGLFAGLLQEVSNRSGVFDLDRGIELFGLAMLGGVGSLVGPLVAAAIRVLPLTWWPDWEHLSNLQLLIAGPLAVVVYLRSPDGLVGIVQARLRRRTEASDRSSPRATEPAERDDVPRGRPAALRCRGCTTSFGGLRALDGVDLDVAPGEIVALLGTNGAGKSTLLDVVSGRCRADAGSVELLVDDRTIDVVDLLPHQRAAVGIGRTFQDVRLFGSMSVTENLLVATHGRGSAGLLANGLALPVARREDLRARREVERVVGLLALDELADRRLDELSYGTVRIVELAAMLVLRPRLLLLDEPSAGLAEAEALELRPFLRRIREDTGASILLVEHDVGLVTAVADRAVCLDAGRVLAVGHPDEVLTHPSVVSAYVGGPVP